ncbi:alpha/beta hydrolase [Allokutzneria oryzae]|uniref:Alpha/beta hydrolase n=1 Tax=Allokutzneria oryzae TaxID=1378989 RepID=A0ABV6A1L1_9PSEU
MGGTFDMAVARRKATNPAKRIGVLVLNPGGPGASGVRMAVGAKDLFSAEVQERYDLVGFDPRGIAGSTQVRCSGEVIGRKPRDFPRNQAEFDELVAYNRELREDCRKWTGPLFDHVDTLSVVEDMDALRKALGEKKISYYGVSYGTLIGQQYAQRYGANLRGMVLDSVMDHGLNAKDMAASAAAGAEDSFAEFARWCATDAACALHGKPVAQQWKDFLTASDRGELLEFGSIPISPEYAIGRAYSAFIRVEWQQFATWMSELRIGTAPTERPAARGIGTQAHGRFAVFCQDWSMRPASYEDLRRTADAERAAAPAMRFSPELREAMLDCAGWPPPTNPSATTVLAPTTPTIMVANARHDPSTPYAWATGAYKQMRERAVLHTYDGWGHGVYHRGQCNRAAIDAYLLGGPPRDATCGG